MEKFRGVVGDQSGGEDYNDFFLGYWILVFRFKISSEKEPEWTVRSTCLLQGDSPAHAGSH